MQKLTYFDLADPRRLAEEYPVGDALLARFGNMSRDELEALREQRFRRLIARGWEIPFYRRLWSASGIEPGDIRGLADLPRLPTFDKSDLMASIEACPPFGDFAGFAPDDRPPLVLHTTSGTTGRPQPLLFGPRGREIQNLLVARNYMFQGVSARDVVHSVYGHGMVNGGHHVREAVLHYVGALFISAGTGVETRSVNQVGLIAQFGATVLVGFVDYLRKLASVARDEGLLDAAEVRMICGHLGTEDRTLVETAWGGAKAYDWYGVGDTGAIAAEGPERDGLHVWEDAQVLEILDIDTGRPVAPGETGDMVVTTLYKDDVAPCIRFNTHDISQELTGGNPAGLPFRRIAGFRGRSDNMVKLRGINIFPHAIGALLRGRADLNGEYCCRVTRAEDGRDTMEVILESTSGYAGGLADLLRSGLGIEVQVSLTPPGGTADLTQITRRQKPLRLLDLRRS